MTETNNTTDQTMQQSDEIEQQDICDEFVRNHAVSADEAVSWVHIGIDDYYHPTGGYWFPTGETWGDATGWVPSKSDIPTGDIIQYPCSDREPEQCGLDNLPGVVNRTLSGVEEQMSDSGQSTNEKGSRNEREAANIIGRVRGSGSVEKVDGYSNTDPWNFADVIAIGDGKVLFVQVKTNRFTPEARRKYLNRMHRLDFDHARFEVWVRVDYEGWRMHRYNPDADEFQQYIEMDTCDHEETVEAYREAVGYYVDIA